MQDLKDATAELLARNFVGIKKLRSYAGRCTHVSNLLFAWRPFLDPLWAASSSTSSAARRINKLALNSKSKKKHKKSKALRGTLWTKQINASLLWIASFLAGLQGPLSRTWNTDFFHAPDDGLMFVLDASPYGLGGVLFDGESPVAYFGSKLTKDDVKIHKHAIGDCAGQQIWECLVVLVAMRAWKHLWLPRKSSVTLRSDNYSALAMASRMKVPSSANLIGRELALLYTNASFEPRFVDHVPGIANTLSDDLSRLADTHNPHEVPASLKHLTPTLIPRRTRAWYSSLSRSMWAS